MTGSGGPDPENPAPSATRNDLDEALLELASRLADQAGDDEPATDSGGDSRERTLPDFPDRRMRAAIEDIGRLVGMRRLATESGSESRTPRGIPQTPLDVPPRWGWFEPEERLGSGGSGAVYKARDTHLGHHVALKLFHEQRMGDTDLDAFLMEGRQHALVKHPNIVVIHGADEYEGRVGIWMEHVDGITLRELVEERGGPRSPGEAVSIGVELCSALAAVHQRGLTHGDVKAQNVMRERATGRTVLMDFSSSRPANVADSPGGMIGTPLYMAPELFSGGRTDDPRSDLYSLGVLLFYLLTGRYPYFGENLRELKEALQNKKPLLLEDLRPDLPPGLADVVQKAIATDAGVRFQSAGEFQQALRALPAPPLGTTRPDPGDAPAPQEEDLSSLVRTVRFVGRAALVAAFVALLGYLNHLLYNTVLRIPDEMASTSLTAAVGTGLRSLGFTIVLGVIEIAAVVVLWATAAVLGRGAPARLVRRAVERMRQWSPDALSTVFAILCVGAVALTTFLFRDLWGVVMALLEADSGSVVDTSLLRRACGDEPVEAIRFSLGYSQTLLLLSAGWLVVFGTLVPPRVPTPQARFMKAVSALAIVVGFGILCTPWRLLWLNDSPRVELGELKGYVVAQDRESLVIYAPSSPAGEQRHLVIPRSDPRITKVGDTPEYIFGVESCGEGATQ